MSPTNHLADALPEIKANPSLATFEPGYLEQQQSRLPAHKYRRLHLNLPGLPEGSAFTAEIIMGAVDRGVRIRPFCETLSYVAFVDMSGGSSDDAVMAIAHKDPEGRAVLDRIVDQGQRPPFDPRKAVERFVEVLSEYGIKRVTGDRYAGQTFRADFQKHGIKYIVSHKSKHELYESLEPHLNGGNVVLLDHGEMESQFLSLVWRGSRIDHPGGEHDDYANAAAGVIDLVLDKRAKTAADYMGAIRKGESETVLARQALAEIVRGPGDSEEEEFWREIQGRKG